MRSPWERDVSYNARRIREAGLTPWAQAQKWRRRFWYAAFVIVVLILMLLAIYTSR